MIKSEKQNLIKSYPACNIFQRDADKDGITNITTKDILCKPDHLGTYQAGSIVSDAIEHGECPIEAVETCQQKMIDHPHSGHSLHWIIALCTALHDGSTVKEDRIEVHYGMKVRFEGKVFTIEKDSNNNLRFKEIVKTHSQTMLQELKSLEFAVTQSIIALPENKPSRTELMGRVNKARKVLGYPRFQD